MDIHPVCVGACVNARAEEKARLLFLPCTSPNILLYPSINIIYKGKQRTAKCMCVRGEKSQVYAMIPLEKERETHSSTLAWKIPWMEEPHRLQSTGSQRVGHDGATSFSFHFHAMTH